MIIMTVFLNTLPNPYTLQLNLIFEIIIEYFKKRNFMSKTLKVLERIALILSKSSGRDKVYF